MLLKKSQSMLFGKVVSYIMGFILLSLPTIANAVVPNDLVSVPEPSTIILMGIGLAALGFVRWRK